MIEPAPPHRPAAMASTSAPIPSARIPLPPPGGPDPAAAAAQPSATGPAVDGNDPVLCHHCGRTASNGISCEGACVADSGY